MNTFFFEQLTKDEGRRAELEMATDALRRIGLPQVLLELASDVAFSSFPDGASRDAFQRGYRRCIQDIFFFRKVYVEPPQNQTMPAPSFNAIDHLEKNNVISKQEAVDLRNRQQHGKPIPS